MHGEALGAAEVSAARAALDWPYPPFEVPEPIRAEWDARAKGAAAEKNWQRRFRRYQKAFPELAAEFERRIGARLPADSASLFDAALATAQATNAPQATRASSGAVLNSIGPGLPELLGGSADLAGSNGVELKGPSQSKARPDGRVLPMRSRC